MEATTAPTRAETIKQILGFLAEAWNDSASKHAIEVRLTASTRGAQILLRALNDGYIEMTPATTKQLREVASHQIWTGESRTVQFTLREKWYLNKVITKLITISGVIERIGVIHPK